jgi:phosphoglucan,water dikinase
MLSNLARDLGARLLNIHLFHDLGLAAYVEAIRPLIRATADAGLLLAIENTPSHPPEKFNELFERLSSLRAVPTGHVGFCLDLGHANLCAATRNNYLAFVDRLDPQVPLIHLHFHENWGDADNHLPLFTGPAGRNDSGIRGVLQRLGQRHFSGAIILEQWPHPPSLLNQARDRLLSLWGEEVDRSKTESAPTQIRRPFPLTPALSPGERAGVRGKQPPDLQMAGFADALISADKRSRSWREKLDSVRELLVHEHHAFTLAQLIDVAIYLRFLGAGQIQCVEDGRHFRPGHHARIAQQIQQRLAGVSSPDTAFMVRKIYPSLPSSALIFQRAEPLTRIRDIAHRNDIPQDLKREIKTTLQNKLHRCAGPEDLVTSAGLLKRITAPGVSYSPAFVEQFRVFHDELKEFFNARSLEEQLRALQPSATSAEAGLVQAFLERTTAASLPEQIVLLGCLTRLRRSLLDQAGPLAGAETPLGAPASHQQTPLGAPASSRRVPHQSINPSIHQSISQEDVLLADIALEDFAFVLLSKMNSALEAAPDDQFWEPALDTLPLVLANLELSGVVPEESRIVQTELHAWRPGFDPAERESLLRLKASVDRGRRLAEDYSDRILNLFPQRVEKLGRALGVAEHAIRVFCDAEIRGHVVFQFAKLVSSLLRRIREQSGLPPWDVLVTGEATGRVSAMERLDSAGSTLTEPTIVLLQAAEGDEEIPRSVTGIVLAHEMPHLSHLGVRARQAGVVFVASEEPNGYGKLCALQGERLHLTATPEKVEWTRMAGSEPAGTPAPVKPVRIPLSRLVSQRTWLPLEEVCLETAGAKANGARRLAELARQHHAGFQTPPALAIPFGVMERSLDAVPDLAADYGRLLQRLDTLPPEAFGAATESLRAIIGQLRVPEEIPPMLAKQFGPHARLMVRSSANCEDLVALAGAGLYESVANVAPAEAATAVRTVWASLWTRRATLSRRQAGLPHSEAHIAELIQQMVTPDYSFVLHTLNPLNRDADEVYAEVAVGLGETLVSGAVRGAPYRLVCNKRSGKVTTLTFANFSYALRPDPARGLMKPSVDYSRIELSRSAAARTSLGQRLAEIGLLVERAFHRPQDIEGAVVGNTIFLVQARPQQGV